MNIVCKCDAAHEAARAACASTLSLQTRLVAIAADVRNAVHNSDMGATRYEAFEPADPARVPSRTLAWTAAVIGIIVIAGFTIWRTQLLTPPTGEEIAEQQAEKPAAASAGAG